MWKVAKDVVLAAAVLFTICLVFLQRKGDGLFYWLLGLSAVYFGFHAVVWSFNPDIYRESAILGTVYNLRLPAFLLLGYGAALLYPGKFVFRSVLKIILIVSTIVAFLGVLQYFLPKDLLTHLGYGLERGARPAFFIDDNPNLSRIMSTLREPNALGAYLILPFAALLLLFLRSRDNRRRIMLAAAGALHAWAILLTHSRSAWLGLALAVFLVVLWRYRERIIFLAKKFWPLLVASVVLLGAFSYLVRDTYFFQHYIIHSDPDEELVDLDSNDLHVLLIKEGVDGVVEKPLGHGPGTAGLASIRSPDGGQLTENYYVQVGYEVGVLGLLVFLAINVLVYLRLQKRGDYIGWMLCASFWAYFVANMLLHTWANETVAAQWWLLAGMALLPLASLKSGGRRPGAKENEAS